MNQIINQKVTRAVKVAKETKLLRNIPETAKLLRGCDKLSGAISKLNKLDQDALENAVKRLNKIKESKGGENAVTEFLNAFNLMAKKVKSDDEVIARLFTKLLENGTKSESQVTALKLMIESIPISAKGDQALKLMASDLFQINVPCRVSNHTVSGVKINGEVFSSADWRKFLQDELESFDYLTEKDWRKPLGSWDDKFSARYAPSFIDPKVKNASDAYLADEFNKAMETLGIPL